MFGVLLRGDLTRREIAAGLRINRSGRITRLIANRITDGVH
jgi:hypothetical protein